MLAEGCSSPAFFSSFSLALRAAISLVAAPQDEPPTKSLALLAEVWPSDHATQLQPTPNPDSVMAGRRQLKEHITQLLQAPGLDSWPLGALQLRAVMKALLGQMPPSTLG